MSQSRRATALRLRDTAPPRISRAGLTRRHHVHEVLLRSAHPRFSFPRPRFHGSYSLCVLPFFFSLSLLSSPLFIAQPSAALPHLNACSFIALIPTRAPYSVEAMSPAARTPDQYSGQNPPP